MKNKIQQKIIAVLKNLLTCVGVIIMGGFALYLLGFSVIALALSIGIAIPVFLLTNLVKTIKQNYDKSKFQKNSINTLQNGEEVTMENVITKIEKIQETNTKNNEVNYIEELVPISEEQLRDIQNSKSGYNNYVVDSYLETKNAIATSMDLQEIENLKRKLITLSFKLQDLSSENKKCISENTYPKRSLVKAKGIK